MVNGTSNPAPVFSDVERAARMSMDELGQCAAKTRKMRRRATTNAEADRLRDLWRQQINLLDQASFTILRRINDSNEMKRAINTLNKITDDLAEARRQMTTAAKAIEQATKVVNIAGQLLAFFV
jgi:hypothetical protein